MRSIYVTFALAAACALGACNGSNESTPVDSAEQSSAPDPIEIVEFDDLDGALDSMRGEGMLLNFWATWCAPCVAEMPELVEVGEEYADRGGRIVGISYDLMVAGVETETIVETVSAFLERRELSLPVLIFDDVDHARIDERFSLPGEIPVTLAIDKEGTIVDRQHGQAGKARFEEMMEKALGL